MSTAAPAPEGKEANSSCERPARRAPLHVDTPSNARPAPVTPSLSPYNIRARRERSCGAAVGGPTAHSRERGARYLTPLPIDTHHRTSTPDPVTPSLVGRRMRRGIPQSPSQRSPASHSPSGWPLASSTPVSGAHPRTSLPGPLVTEPLRSHRRESSGEPLRWLRRPGELPARREPTGDIDSREGGHGVRCM